MSKLSKEEGAAIAAVARSLESCAQRARAIEWEGGDGFLRIGASKIAPALIRRELAKAAARMPRLRYDKVVVRLIERLRASLSESVPEGKTVIVTITAPIRQWSKTAAEIDAIVRSLLTRRSTEAAAKKTIHGNRVSIRLVSGGSKRTPKVVGYVHNPDISAAPLVELTDAVLKRL
jgi:hypothetical protein